MSMRDIIDTVSGKKKREARKAEALENANSSDPMIRRRAAMYPERLPLEVQQKLANDPDANVRWVLINHAGDVIIHQMRNDPHPIIRKKAKELLNPYSRGPFGLGE